MRRFWLLLLLCGTASAGVQAVLASYVLWNLQAIDQFQRANGGLGANWTTTPSHLALSIVSDMIECSSIGSTDCAEYYTGSWKSDQCSQVQINTLNATDNGVVDILVRQSSSAYTYYAVSVMGPLGSSATISLHKTVGGTHTTLVAATTESVASGAVVGACVRGSSLFATLNGKQLSALTITDTSITSGVPGIQIESNGQAETDVILANWAGYFAWPATTVAGTAVKFHAGHYVLCGSRPTTPSVLSFCSTTMAGDAVTVINPATSKPGFVGGLDSESWYYLDMCAPVGQSCNVGPTDGNSGGGTLPTTGGYTTANTPYNTSQIDSFIAAFQSAYAGTGVTPRVIIQISLGTYQSHPSCPTTPQALPYSSGNGSESSVPDYIINGISGQGSDCLEESYFEGYAAAFYRNPVAVKWNALIAYLGAKYDGNPAVEAIVPFDQTADTLCLTASSTGSGCASTPSDLTESSVATAHQAIISATAAAFPTSNKIYTTNFPGAPQSTSDLVSLAAYGAARAVGFGGPDLSYIACVAAGCSSQTHVVGPTWGEQILFGLGTTGDPTSQNFGTTNYVGQVPIMYQQQQGAYQTACSSTNCGPGWEASAYSLNATHVPWQDDKHNSSADLTWTQVTNALIAEDFRIHSTCPSAYTNGCNTN